MALLFEAARFDINHKKHRTLAKIADFVKKKHSSEPETKVIFCFVLASETKVMLIRIAVEPV